MKKLLRRSFGIKENSDYASIMGLFLMSEQSGSDITCCGEEQKTQIGKKDIKVGEVFGLQPANPDLILGSTYDPLNTTKYKPEQPWVWTKNKPKQ